MDYNRILKEFYSKRPNCICIKEADRNSPFSYYEEMIALVDYETDPSDIILYFPKESDGVKLEYFVKKHPHAKYFTLIEWEFIC